MTTEYREWRREAQERFIEQFHKQPGASYVVHRGEIMHAWDEEEFLLAFENGISPAVAVDMYFDNREVETSYDANDGTEGSD